jgi:KEOPS complex subunit Pcc1
MSAKARVRLRFKSRQQLESVFKALKPETRTSLTERSKVKLTREGDSLNFIFEASDTSALRATINSYLRWALLTKDVLESLETQAC